MRPVETIVAAVMLVLFGAMVAAALTYPPEVALVPLVVGIPATLLAAWQLFREATGRTGAPAEPPHEVRGSGDQSVNEGAAIAWIGLFSLAVLVGGFVVGGTLALMATQRLWLRESWRVTAIGGAVALFVSYVCFERLLGLTLYSGWLATWIL